MSHLNPSPMALKSQALQSEEFLASRGTETPEHWVHWQSISSLASGQCSRPSQRCRPYMHEPSSHLNPGYPPLVHSRHRVSVWLYPSSGMQTATAVSVIHSSRQQSISSSEPSSHWPLLRLRPLQTSPLSMQPPPSQMIPGLPALSRHCPGGL